MAKWKTRKSQKISDNRGTDISTEHAPGSPNTPSPRYSSGGTKFLWKPFWISVGIVALAVIVCYVNTLGMGLVFNDKSTIAGLQITNKETYLNIAAFPAQPVGVLGNATRYNPLVRGFNNLNENVSLGKSFYLHESLRLDFRAEAFNLFNRTVFASPNANINSNTFGVVTAQSNSPRQLQLALKLYF